MKTELLKDRDKQINIVIEKLGEESLNKRKKTAAEIEKKANEKEFYNRIFSTQMFIEFIYKRMMPKNYNEKVEILFFEEKINEAKLKKSFFKSKEVNPNLLLTSKEYDYDNYIQKIFHLISKEIYDT